MTNGFYNTDNITGLYRKGLFFRKFLEKAVMLSYNVSCQSLKDSFQRKEDKSLTITKLIANGVREYNAKLSVVDRYAYYNGAIAKHLCNYEITLYSNINSTYLYIYLNEDNFNKLIKQYGLTLIEH